MNKRLVLAGSALMASLGLCAAAVPAAAEPVNGSDDVSGVSIDCGDVAGLIDAVNQANIDGGTIKLAERCAYRFEDDFEDSGNALPAITGDVTILGKDSTLIRSSQHGASLFRLLAVNEGGSLTLKGVTVAGGLVDGDGAGIANAGTLKLLRSTVAGNQATGNGGGISNEGGDVTLDESRVINNAVFDADTDAGDGGGLSNNADGTLTIKSSTIAGNSSEEDGGGIENWGTLAIDGSRIVNNVARDDDGGAIHNLGTATIDNSKITENWAGIDGGAIDNGEDATLDVLATTFSRNVAGRDGGAINNEGTATLTDSWVKKNQAGRDGGGINNEQEAGADTAELTLEGTKVSENRAAGVGGGINNWAGGVVTLDEDSSVTENEPTNCEGDVPGCDAVASAAVQQNKG
ncbi:hypothetical protein ACQEVG_22365 [Streptomyces sp. CA-135486]|uniref:hypothetical protein n=1 Tax=Streptomyces sp. CA-135486 TaxID=3240049 RepID=UPI003D9462A2